MFSNMTTSWPKSFEDIVQPCYKQEWWTEIWFVADTFLLITGVAPNAALLLLFLVEWKSLSASQVLGLSLAVMDLIFLSTVPVGFMYLAETDQSATQNHSDFSVTRLNTTYPTDNPMDKVMNACSMFNLIGCPLLLACMCVERYLAVMKPVLYLRLRKWEYRMAVSAAVWAITLAFCVVTFLLVDVAIIMGPVTIIISWLFIIMLACLVSVIRSLQQQSPAHTVRTNQRRSESEKRQAVGNVLVVVVPSVMSYLPVLVMFPLVVYIYYSDCHCQKEMCYVLELSFLFPRFGVFIGPLFYFSKARKMCCRSGTENE